MKPAELNEDENNLIIFPFVDLLFKLVSNTNLTGSFEYP